MRIASLLPSATEIVCALGAKDDLVGVSHECDFPPGVEELPQLTRTRSTLPQGSGEIDRSIREILRDALSVYKVDLEAFERARPEVIVTQDLCDVCAVSMQDVHRALQELGREDTVVVRLTPTRLADVWADVKRVADAIERTQTGIRVAQDLEQRCREIEGRAQLLFPQSLEKRPKVLSIEWLDPVMIGGTWMPELITMGGGHPLVTEPGQHAPTLDLAQLSELDPDVVLVKPCGFDLERTRRELALFEQNLPWSKWKVVPEGRVFLADGNAFFNRPGPRLVESLEILVACVHPTAFADFAKRHTASVRRIDANLEVRSL